MQMDLRASLSPRTAQLLDSLGEQSQRTRYAIIMLTVLAALSVAANLNEKAPGGNLARMDVRLFTTAFDEARSPTSGIIKKRMDDKDKGELEYLRRLQIMNLEGIQIPLIGIHISAAHAGFLGALAGLLLYGWLIFSVEKEQSTLANLVYPLIAKEDDEISRVLWNGSGDSLRPIIDFYRNETCRIRENLSTNFLFIYADSRPRLYERFASALIVAPAICLFGHACWDIHWDMNRSFPESGGLTYVDELRDDADRLCEYLAASFDKAPKEAVLRFKAENCSYGAVGPLVSSQGGVLSDEQKAAARAAEMLDNHASAIQLYRYFQLGLSVAMLGLAFKVIRKTRLTSTVLTGVFGGNEEARESGLRPFVEKKLDAPLGD